ncbi:MAG: type I-B CRISPR-associated protein Cas5 [Clostridia bacterium]|nr:type I-B CRISPR-associated protein Cas5 [Clostridia bacterium]
MNVIVFDIWGDYGHFKKFHTTASPLTFSFPPPTAVIGIVAAVLGMDKEKYWDSFTIENTKVAIRIINPVKKIRCGINVIDTKSAGPMFNRIKQRSQLKYELLKDAHYRIYFHHNDLGLMEELKKMLQAHKTVYTLSLGGAQMLADFSFVKECEAEEISGGEYIQVHSVVPLQETENMDSYLFKFEENRLYSKEIVSLRMNVNREVLGYKTVLFDMNGLPITTRGSQIMKVGSENVMFM